MQSLRKILIQDRKKADFGEVISRGLNNQYTVRAGGRVFLAGSAAGYDLKPGSRVILMDTGAGQFVVGTDTRQIRRERTVTINV